MRVRHSDTQAGFGMRAKSICRHLKIAYYLDEGLTATSGALRVIPGSHRAGSAYADGLESSMAELQADGRGSDVPAMTLATRPGDIVCFGPSSPSVHNSRLGQSVLSGGLLRADHRLKHAAFGGGERRRMFT